LSVIEKYDIHKAGRPCDKRIYILHDDGSVSLTDHAGVIVRKQCQYPKLFLHDHKFAEQPGQKDPEVAAESFSKKG
jgi:hypothetical protein